MALFKSQGKVQVHNHIPTSGLLPFRGHFETHFEGRAQGQITLATRHCAAEYKVCCKSVEGFQVLICVLRTRGLGWLST